MALKLILLLLFVCAPVLSVQAKKQSDNLIIPGERVGFLKRDTTETGLKGLLPKNQVQRVLYDIGEGEFRCATEIFPNSNKAVTIVWESDKSLYEPYKDSGVSQKKCNEISSLKNVEFVVIEKNNSYWHTANGIGVGMNLMRLEHANNAPVTFSVCDCHYGGNVMDWNGGKFDKHLYVHLDYFSAHGLESGLRPYITKLDEGIDSNDVPSHLKSKITIDKIVVHFHSAESVNSQ